MNFRYLMFFMLAITVALGAAVKRTGKVHTFDREIKKSQLAIGLLYKEDKQTRKDKELRKKLKDLHKDFREVSKDEDEVAFVSANISKKKLFELKDRYHVTKTPNFLLFKDGILKPFKDESGTVVSLIGFPSRQQMRIFISDNFQDYIDEIKKEKREEAKERAERRAWSYGPSFYVGWGGYPGEFGYGYGYPARWGWGYGGRSGCCW